MTFDKIIKVVHIHTRLECISSVAALDTTRCVSIISGGGGIGCGGVKLLASLRQLGIVENKLLKLYSLSYFNFDESVKER